MKALSLLYHDVVQEDDANASGFPGPSAARYKMGIDEFEMHLKAIAGATREKPASVFDLSEREELSCPLLLTFDDGGTSAYLHIADVLEALGWSGHFFIPAKYIGKRSYLSPLQIRALRERGHVMGSHSYSHPQRMSQLPWEELVEEWSRSVQILADILGEPVTVASVPGGYYSRRVAQAASSAGIRALFTSEPTTRCYYVGNCLVLGRYTVMRGTPARTAAGFASGQLPPRLRQWLSWNSKKVAKSLGGELYLKARKFLLERT